MQFGLVRLPNRRSAPEFSSASSYIRIPAHVEESTLRAVDQRRRRLAREHRTVFAPTGFVIRNVKCLVPTIGALIANVSL